MLGKDQLCETQTNLEVKSRDCKSYTDKQNTHNMAVSTTLNSKLEQMLNVLNSTAQRINTLASKYSSQASSSGLNDHAGGRRATSRTLDKRPPPPSPPDNDPPPPPPPDREEGGRKVLTAEVLATLVNPDVNIWVMDVSTLLLNFIVKDAKVRFVSIVSR